MSISVRFQLAVTLSSLSVLLAAASLVAFTPEDSAASAIGLSVLLLAFAGMLPAGLLAAGYLWVQWANDGRRSWVLFGDALQATMLSSLGIFIALVTGRRLLFPDALPWDWTRPFFWVGAILVLASPVYQSFLIYLVSRKSK